MDQGLVPVPLGDPAQPARPAPPVQTGHRLVRIRAGELREGRGLGRGPDIRRPVWFGWVVQQTWLGWLICPATQPLIGGWVHGPAFGRVVQWALGSGIVRPAKLGRVGEQTGRGGLAEPTSADHAPPDQGPEPAVGPGRRRRPGLPIAP